MPSTMYLFYRISTLSFFTKLHKTLQVCIVYFMNVWGRWCFCISHISDCILWRYTWITCASVNMTKQLSVCSVYPLISSEGSWQVDTNPHKLFYKYCHISEWTHKHLNQTPYAINLNAFFHIHKIWVILLLVLGPSHKFSHMYTLLCALYRENM